MHVDNFRSLTLWLRDGVDVYISPDSIVHFVFLSTRKRLRLRVAPPLIESLQWFDGKLTVAEIEKRCKDDGSFASGSDSAEVSFYDFSSYLYGKGVLVNKDWMRESFPPKYIARFSRQLNFLLDVEGSTEAAVALFKKITKMRIALIGIGAVGSWILKELAQMGFQKFVLVDPKALAVTDISRNAFFEYKLIGVAKVDIAEEYIHKQALYPETRVKRKAFDLYTDIESLIGDDVDLIINTADEPYIGATSIKLSRYCVKSTLPLLVAGGFDAHLGSLSEMIVPGETPCSDCYAMHFKIALKGWKPISHPITDRTRGFGGLSSMNCFAASAAVLKVVRLLSCKGGGVGQGRGEFLFDKYQIDSFNVNRNPSCQTCGDRHEAVC